MILSGGAGDPAHKPKGQDKDALYDGERIFTRKLADIQGKDGGIDQEVKRTKQQNPSWEETKGRKTILAEQVPS